MTRQEGHAVTGHRDRPTPSDIQRHTEEAFLDVLFERGPCSRAHIARVTGFSKPTISAAADRLTSAGILVRRGVHRSSERGRPVELYDVNADYGHTVGVAIERGHVAVRALNFLGEVVHEDRVDALTDDNVPAALSRARDLMQDISDRLDSPCLATAVGVAAPIDPRTSTIRAWPTSPFTEANAALGAALGIPDGRPVHVDNDVNWATLAEHRVGSMQQASDFLYIYLGAGVGAGLFLGGRVHRGHHGLAGEICFTRMENEEIFMGRLARSPIGTHDGWGGSIDTARALELFNDPGTVTDLGPLVDDIARVIANIATAIDPSAIVVGGPLAEAAPLIEALGQRLQLPSLADVAITPTALGRDAPLCGAALGALELARRNRRR